MTLIIVLLRTLTGIPTIAELIGDRLIPTLSLDLFFRLLDLFGGGNEFKRFGIGSVFVGQLVVGMLIGAAYALYIERTSAHQPVRVSRGIYSRRGWLLAVLVPLLVWLVTLVLLRPLLGTNYRGLPQDRATYATIVGLGCSYLTYGLVLAWTYRSLTLERSSTGPEPVGRVIGRRTVVVGGAAAALASGGLLVRLYQRSSLHYDGLKYQGPDVEAITPNDRFYAVTKNILDPDVDSNSWRLDVTGQVERPHTYDLPALLALPASTQETTLSCISNSVGNGLVSNAVWKGFPLRDLIETAGPRPGVVEVALHGVDNYIDTISLEKALDPTTFVAYQMNDAPLPRRHGYPVRILVPGRFGEKSVKWVTRIALADAEHDVKGFYERQGWGPTFVTQTLSRIDVPATGQVLQASAAEPLLMKGIAFAGDRGIARVEVSTDAGQTWQAATLDYPGMRLTWSLWSYLWMPDTPGDYELMVRAVDGSGAVQTAEERPITPDGATGHHRIGVRVVAGP